MQKLSKQSEVLIKERSIMSKEYDKYLEQHISNVKKGFDWVCKHLPEVLPEFSLVEQISDHDKSKYKLDEYVPYDKYFYGQNKSYNVVQEFNYAWLTHIHNNPHHWQYWVLINDDPTEGEKILDMPLNYIIEMICDWWAFSWSKENLHEIFSWYDEHKDYMKLSPNTRKTVEHILDEIKWKIDNKR